jgi:hypothetical protein
MPQSKLALKLVPKQTRNVTRTPERTSKRPGAEICIPKGILRTESMIYVRQGIFDGNAVAFFLSSLSPRTCKCADRRLLWGWCRRLT